MGQALTTALCRDCFAFFEAPAGSRCPTCKGPRVLRHSELATLTLAHIDCDAFYASVEKRDDPSLANKPVIVGGGHRGVVSAACYIARLSGVRSAMPMFKARKACPDAVVIRPNMDKYARVGREIRELMRAVTPLVEPLSIDEAFLDLAGTEKLHHAPAAVTLARLVSRIEREIGVTASIGLSYNKFLAKVASDLDKPRGFAVIGQSDAQTFLSQQPVSLIWGVGKALGAALARDGIHKIGDLSPLAEIELVKRYGAMGNRLYHFSRGQDSRQVDPSSLTKSISVETTLDQDLADPERLRAILWPLCEKLSYRMKKAGYAGQGLTLKAKTSDFKTLTRSSHLTKPTLFAEEIYQLSLPLLEGLADGRRFRLIGVGLSHLGEAAEAEGFDLADPDRSKRTKIEKAMDQVRERLGEKAIFKGRNLKSD